MVAAGLQLRLPIALTSEEQSRKISQIAGVALIVYGGLCWEISSGQVDKANREARVGEASHEEGVEVIERMLYLFLKIT